MAKVHGVAGAYALSEARKRLYLVVGCVLILMMGYGWVAGYATSAIGGLGAAAAAVIAVVVGWGSLELVGRASRGLQRDQHRFLRGATAEEFVGWLLDELEDGWHVFHGIQLQD